jgi:hypothetical protein
MPIAVAVVAQAWNAASRSRRRYRRAWSHGNASRSCCAVNAAVGWSVTATCTTRRRSCARITRTHTSRHVCSRDDEEIGGCDLPGMSGEKRAPRLRRWLVASPQVLRDRSLRAVEAKFQQLAMTPRCAPEGIALRHGPNQRADVSRDRRSADASAAFPGPIQSEALAMPGDDGLRIDDDERGVPTGPRRDSHAQRQRSTFTSRNRRGRDR